VIEQPELAVSFAEINALMGLDTIRQMEQRFLTAHDWRRNTARRRNESAASTVHQQSWSTPRRDCSAAAQVSGICTNHRGAA
jgi:hypothetical protein